jgi:hypothetical protein
MRSSGYGGSGAKRNQPGGQRGIPTRSQVDEFLQSEPESSDELLARTRGRRKPLDDAWTARGFKASNVPGLGGRER